MDSILGDPANRVRLLKARFSESQIAWLHVHMFEDSAEILGVNWDVTSYLKVTKKSG